MREPLRLGILGAARIAPFAVIRHARTLPEVDVVAVAEEYHPERYLQRYAKKHRIPRTHRSFDALLASPDIDAVYAPKPATPGKIEDFGRVHNRLPSNASD